MCIQTPGVGQNSTGVPLDGAPGEGRTTSLRRCYLDSPVKSKLRELRDQLGVTYGAQTPDSHQLLLLLRAKWGLERTGVLPKAQESMGTAEWKRHCGPPWVVGYP